MDISSLPESEQQHLNPHFQEQVQAQQYPQYQIQDYYYQTQGQSYDHSYYSYYLHYPPQNQWQYDQHPQNYAYYQPNYSVAYQQPPYHQHESAPRVSAPQEAAQMVDSGGTGISLQAVQQQGVYPLPQSSVDVVVQPGMNPAAPAAIAALEQLTQLARSMDAAERAMARLPAKSPGFELVPMLPRDGQHQHRGGGRRGGRPFRGGGWGNDGQHQGSAPPPRGKGHGRGNARFRSFKAQSVISTSSYTEPSAAKENSADAAKKAAESASAPERIAPNRRPRQIAWCELCRVDCTSLEILEQHKNGKRHKKNLLRIEELKNAIKPADSIQNHPECINDSKPVESQQPPIAEDSEEQKSAENLPSKAGNAEYRMENNLQNNTQEKPEVPMGESSNKQGRKPRTNLFDNRRRGIKRKMKGGRGGKRIKTYETHRRVVEPPKPKVVAPLICDLCNVKCDTREVLDRHLSGKKHIAKFKRFQGHQAIYGPTGLQALYPPNPIGQTHSLPQGHQSFYNPQGSFLAQGGYFPSQGHQSASAAAGLNPRSSQSSTPQQSESTSALDANPANAV
ncbi:hypothetical protein P3X46_016527 [Hevea brasiliensis]|uniref:U1-type domain-containing protein n=1 Tax=Hevea brasiliensis TaxID=3981 RepID=A0ABQ9LZF8_HEVBR|nr:uncharacterized protein LOC110672046 [Hevea brasiliensis]KAJ9173386.1 hypothetical protein P3X46_016527 [Hevea brasiliensis]